MTKTWNASKKTIIAKVKKPSVISEEVPVPLDKDQALAILLDLQRHKHMVEQHTRMVEQHKSMIDVLVKKLADLFESSNVFASRQPVLTPPTQQTIQLKWPNETTACMDTSERSSYNRDVVRRGSAKTRKKPGEECSNYNSDEDKRIVGGSGVWPGEASDESSHYDKQGIQDDKKNCHDAHKEVNASTAIWMPQAAPRIRWSQGNQSSTDICKIPFFTTIHNANECNGFLHFDAKIPSTKFTALYIRDSYKSIASQIQPGINKVIITGTPGIGKSLFLIYLLWKLVTTGKRVLFMYHAYTIYYDGEGGIFCFGSDALPTDADDSFWNETLWCLFDAKEGKSVHLGCLPYPLCTFVLSTSPRRDIVNDFQKPPRPQVFYMSLWTEAELTKIASSHFPSRTHWLHRFQILGGIPRYVLEDVTQQPELILEKASTNCSLNRCIRTIGLHSTIPEKSRVVHSLIHITSISPFTESSVCYASQAAFDIICRKYGNDAKPKMKSLLPECEGNPLIAALCGYVFERHALECLEKGGSFDCRQLMHGSTKSEPVKSTLVIQPGLKTIVENVSIDQKPQQPYVPKATNYASFDAWITGIGGFQMIVGKKLAIRAKEAKTDLALLGDGANKFYWLVPPLYYDTFTKSAPYDVDQYAVLIPWPEI